MFTHFESSKWSLSLPPENISKTKVSFMFLEGIERDQWHEMGQWTLTQWNLSYISKKRVEGFRNYHFFWKRLMTYTSQISKVPNEAERFMLMKFIISYFFLTMFPFDRPENIRKPYVFWCFLENQKERLGRNGQLTVWV